MNRAQVYERVAEVMFRLGRRNPRLDATELLQEMRRARLVIVFEEDARARNDDYRAALEATGMEGRK